MSAATDLAPVHALGRRIWVVGTSGSGKSTLASTLAVLLRLPNIEFDALYHGPNWAEPTQEEFTSRVNAALCSGEWVCDGNYSFVREMMLAEAETIIWLDLSFSVVFTSVVRRTLRRCIKKEVLWNGNRERLWQQFFARDSLFWWVISTHHSRRKRFETMFAETNVASKLVRFRNRREVNGFVEKLRQSC